MATENNKNIKYPSKMDVIQSTRKVIDLDLKNQIKSIVSDFLTLVKTKHI
jgi:hypothetical protein